ncbi:MAG: SDR family oxidoreductase [Acidimicrobiaceae bacterium]|nr:SDR family oxidoreductase [Acidimicrobiaceae bacterium]
MNLKDTTALVTGASRGIGEAIAIELSRAGAKVIGVARDINRLEQAMDAIGGVSMRCDLSDSNVVATLIQQIESQHGPIDVLVNNAGVNHTGLLQDATSANIRAVITTNQITPIDLIRQVLPGMRQRATGHIVNISSLAASGGFVGMTLYSSSKSGLSGFHRVLRHELRDAPIGMTLVEIGPIPTDMLTEVYGHESTHRMFKRLQHLQLLPEVSRERVARNVRRAIENNRKHVCLPLRGKIYPILTGAPQKIIDVIMSTIPH